MDILTVIQQHGESTYSISKKMNIKQSTLMGMIKGNPTVSTLRKVSDALGCQVAEFFADELTTAGFTIVKTGEPQEKPQATDNGEVQQAEETKVLRFQYDCPHCGEAIKISIEKA